VKFLASATCEGHAKLPTIEVKSVKVEVEVMACVIRFLEHSSYYEMFKLIQSRHQELML